MSYIKTILCLACSRKMSGYCVAGKEVKAGQYGDWIRPVSRRKDQEISETERRCAGGQKANVLDVLRIRFAAHVPVHHQTENHLIDGDQVWSRIGKATWDDVRSALDNLKGPIWANGYSSGHGLNDRVPDSIAKKFGSSLLLLEVSELQLSVAMESSPGRAPKRKVRAHFRFSGISYVIAVTDPDWESSYKQKGDGDYLIGDAILCISLGEVFEGYAYKLVAGIFTKKTCR